MKESPTPESSVQILSVVAGWLTQRIILGIERGELARPAMELVLCSRLNDGFARRWIVSEDLEDDMRVCKQFLFMVPADRLEEAGRVLARFIAEIPPEELKDHLTKVRTPSYRVAYRSLHVSES